METIWGDPLPSENSPHSNSPSDEEYEELTEALEQYEHSSDTASDEEDFDLTDGNIKIITVENLATHENAISESLDQDNCEDTISDVKNLVHEGKLKSTDLDKSNDTGSDQGNVEKSDVENDFSCEANNCEQDILISTTADEGSSYKEVKSAINEISEDDKKTIERNFSLDKNTDGDIDNSQEKQKFMISVPKLTTISKNEGSSIKLVDITNGMAKVYEVNGALFVDGERTSRYDTDELDEYELYQVDKMVDNGDDDLITTLDIHIQTLPQGVIINSNVFLWDAQWNTMTLVDEQLIRCAICQVYCDRLTCEDHVQTISHLCNMDKYRPLKRFDLAIVRKINVNLHCGICNTIFDIIDMTKHENSKEHEENLLTAINKVSDLMYVTNIHSHGGKNILSGLRNTNYSRNMTSSDRNVTNSDRNMTHSDGNMANSDGNMTNSDRNTSSHGNSRLKRNHGEFHFDANAINNNNINVYEEFNEEEEDCEDEEEEEVEEALEASEEYPYETAEYSTPHQGVSYASMASKPSIQLPKYLKIDLGTREVRVKYETWHMIVKMNSNQFYCMVCHKKDHIRFKSQHCISCQHTEKLAKCAVVRAFEDYLIRTVDDKLYHCGHCNNLQYQNQMEDHIESAHPKVNRNYVETNLAVVTKKAKAEKTKTNNEPKKAESGKGAPNEPSMETKDTDIDIFGDVYIVPFGCVLKISAFSFNMISKMDDEFYCALCDAVFVDVKQHAVEDVHVKRMKLTPYIRPFLNNLTRVVRDALMHCSICNKLFAVTEVWKHNVDQLHTSALAAAMGMKKSQHPENSKRVTKLTDQNANNQTSHIPSLLSIQLPPSIASDISKLLSQKENSKPALANQIPNVGAQKTDKLTRNQSVNPAGVPNNTQPTQTNQNNFLMNLLKVGQNPGQKHPAQNLSNTAQYLPQARQPPNAGQNPPIFGQNPNCRQNIANQPNLGQNLPNPGANLGNPGPNLLNSARLPPVQSFPYPQSLTAQNKYTPLSNTVYPLLPPVNAQNLQNSLLGPPLKYTGPRPSVSPFPNLTSSNSPNLLSPIIQGDKIENQDVGKKTSTIPDNKNETLLPCDNTRPDSNNVRRDSENSRPGSNNIRHDSENSRPGSNNIRRSSVNSKSGSEISKSGVDNLETDSLTDDDELKDFDEEQMVFVKFKTTYFKITNMSYNTLVFLDNGIRYCFVCSSMVQTPQLQKHVESRKHLKCLKENKFLDKYGVQLFRQMYLMYHCGICNELMTRKETKLHLEWSVHVDSYNAAHLLFNKKNRKLLKSGLKEYTIETQKEAIYHNVNEPNFHIRAAYQIVPNLDYRKDTAESKPTEGSKSTRAKKNKMVIQNNVVMKISFEHWHGITLVKNVIKCVICQMELEEHEVVDHVETEYHGVALGKTFDQNYYPALIRKINESTVNCMTCNLELPHNECMIHEHINGRKHNKNKENVINETSNSDSYADCYEDYLNL